jgi:hypothetical protein
LKLFLSALTIAFTLCICWAFTQKPISESGAWMMSDPWGIVTLFDLYIGFFMFGILIFLTIPKKVFLLIWIPALLFLGNVVSLIYLIFYYKNLTTLLGAKNENH